MLCGLSACVCGQVLPEEAEEGEEEQWPDARYQRGTTRLSLIRNATLLSELMWTKCHRLVVLVCYYVDVICTEDYGFFLSE